MTYCYSTGAISGTSYLGGLIGYDRWGLARSVTCCFWDTQTSGQVTNAGGTGRTTAEMWTPSTFFEWGVCGNEGVWTIDEGRDYPRLSWEHSLGQLIQSWLSDFLKGSGTQDSPYLIYTAEDLVAIAGFPCERDKHFRLMFVEGDGIDGSPYLIRTADQLDLISMCPYERDAHFKLMAEIDLSPNLPGRRVFDKAVIESFGGVFDGNHHTISHLTVKGGGYLGLFGVLESGAEVRNLGVVDVNVAGSGYCIGGLVGNNRGSVTQCYGTGAVSGGSSIGGLVGASWGDVIQCYSTGAVSGTDGVGGLAGYNSSSVTQCHSTCVVSGVGGVGGLVGRNGGTIADSYAEGSVSGDSSVGGLAGDNGVCLLEDEEGSFGMISNSYSVSVVMGRAFVGALLGANVNGEVIRCFWDSETSGLAKSAGGTGKTTAGMQTAKTFLEAGWDFVGETANGTVDIWWIEEGKDYPRLWWELPATK